MLPVPTAVVGLSGVAAAPDAPVAGDPAVAAGFSLSTAELTAPRRLRFGESGMERAASYAGGGGGGGDGEIGRRSGDEVRTLAAAVLAGVRCCLAPMWAPSAPAAAAVVLDVLGASIEELKSKSVLTVADSAAAGSPFVFEAHGTRECKGCAGSRACCCVRKLGLVSLTGCIL